MTPEKARQQAEAYRRDKADRSFQRYLNWLAEERAARKAAS